MTQSDITLNGNYEKHSFNQRKKKRISKSKNFENSKVKCPDENCKRNEPKSLWILKVEIKFDLHI